MPIPRPTVLGHPNPRVLEAHCISFLEDRRKATPLAPCWIVVPTQRLRRRLQQALASHLGSCLGISFFNPDSLLDAIAGPAGLRRHPRLRPLVRRILLRKVLAKSKPGRELLSFKDGAASMEPALDDLRESGESSFQAASGSPPSERLLLETYAGLLQLQEKEGFEDDVGWSDRVADALSPDSDLPPVLFYGFGELVGRNWRILQALIQATEVHAWVLLGGRPGDGDAIPGLTPTLLEGEEGRPESVSSFGARGLRAEMEEALNLALDWHRQGTPLEEIAIVARSLRPLRPELGPLLSQMGLEGVVDSGMKTPLRLLPTAQSFLAHVTRGANPEDFLDGGGEEGMEESVLDALREALASAREAGEHSKLPLSELLAEALEIQEIRPWAGKNGAGLPILDFQQARGIPRTRLILTGFHHDSVPKPYPEAGFLSDALRRRLSKDLSFPIPDRIQQRAAEHRMLEQVLRTPSRHLAVLRQHSASDGTSVAASPALLFCEKILGQAIDFTSLPGLPAARAARRVEQGCALPIESALAFAAAGNDWKAMTRLGSRAKAVEELLGMGIPWMETVDSFNSTNLAFDGSLGENLKLDPAATRLEAYGSQPMAFFFEKVLGVQRRWKPPLAGPDPASLGKAIHEVLHQAFLNANEAGVAETAGKEFAARVSPLFRLQAGESPRKKALLEHLEQECRKGLEEFLQWDLGRQGEEIKDSKLKGGPWKVDAALLETRIPVVLDLGEGVSLELDVRTDRIMRGEGTARVSDYKTGKVIGLSDPNAFLRGMKLQNALYVLGLETLDSFKEVLWSMESVRVSSQADYQASTANNGGYGSGTPADLWSRSREGVRETARILLTHLRQGRFPPYIHKDPVMDSWFSTMRLTHPPTLERVGSHSDLSLLFRLREKSCTTKEETSVFFLKTPEEVAS